MHDGSEAIPALQSLYPSPSAAALQLQCVGRQIGEVPAPAAVIDAAVVRRNCRAMLETVDVLGLEFRAHVKTHKVTSAMISSHERGLLNFIDLGNGKASGRRRHWTSQARLLHGGRDREFGTVASGVQIARQVCQRA